MKTLYFDCSSGICGDLTLSAFLDLGLDLNKINRDLSALNLEEEPYIEANKTSLKNIAGTTATVKIKHEPSGRQRSFSEIRKLIENSALNDSVKNKSIEMFDVIARAESKVHNVPVEKVHFHEIGAVDSIADIVGVASCFNQFEPFTAHFSKLPLSGGTVKTAHGLLPLPAPATSIILEGIPVYGVETDKELITPTGASIAKVFSKSFGSFPQMTIERSGTGHAKNSFEKLPGVLRIFEGNVAETFESDTVYVIETTIDNFNTEFYGHVQNLLFENGARDVCLIPAMMKKGRPGHILSVISSQKDFEKISSLILHHTSSIGLRYYQSERKKLNRELLLVETPWGKINAKKIFNSEGSRIYPEYEDLRKISIEKNTPIHVLYIDVTAYLNKQK